MAHTRTRYRPAAGHDWLLPFYDPLLRGLGAESLLRALVAAARLEPGQRVLDVGCGTGTLALLIARLHPGVRVVGLDPDPKALARAERKARRAGVTVQLERGLAGRLPFADRSFERVFSSFVFHHLPSDEKPGALREARRVLAPGGELHLLDFAPGAAAADGRLARLLHRSETLRENREGRIPTRLQEAGFPDVREVVSRRTLLGRVTHWSARAL